MEFRVTNRLTGARQAVPARGKDSSPAEKSAARSSAVQADRLALSQRAVAMLQEQNRREAQERAQRAKARASGKEESSSSPLDAAVKALKTLQKCQKIASRIRAGDKVPPQDERFLLENDPAGYQLAMAARKPKKDPKEWDSVLEEEKKESSSGVSGTGDCAEASACAEGSEAPAGE